MTGALSKFSIYTVILLLLTLSFPGCDIKSPTEGVKVLFNEAPLTLISVVVVDAKTRQQITAAESDSVLIEIDGPDKSYIIDLTEKAATSFSSKRGFFNFAVSDIRPATPENPVKITVIADAVDYISTSKQISISSTKGETYTIALIKRNEPPEGISTTTVNEGVVKSEGEVTEEIIIVSKSDQETNMEVSLTVQKDTVIKDDKGEALIGELKTEITNFDVQSDKSTNEIPGGLFTTILDKTGATEDIVFIPAAVVSLEITDEMGNIAKTFDKPVEVSLEIPGETYNPETGTTITNGDAIPIWNYNEKNTQWEYHSESLAYGPNEKGNYEVIFSITHMSYWSGGWEDETETICDEGLTIHLTGDFNAIEVKIRKHNEGSYLSILEKSINSSYPHVHLTNTPGNTPVTIEAWYGSDIVGSVDVENLCGDDVDLYVSIPGQAVTFNVEVYDINDHDKRMRPNRGIYIGENDSRKYVGYMKDGLITVYGLTEGEEYLVWVFHEDTWYSDTLSVDDRTYIELEFGVEP
ncbi:MAG: hypothetical protein HOC71_18070 [Candidatus Latescibacteria bacterium]|jgi:hypothetical protein|nr:hypothetical protein [Candidatus Latescibacterota bacterium]